MHMCIYIGLRIYLHISISGSQASKGIRIMSKACQKNFLGPTLGVSYSVYLQWSPRICVSYRFLDAAAAAAIER